MDPLDRHDLAMREFDERVHAVPIDRWDDPTPCAAWDVRSLVGHVVREQRWVPELLGGRTVADVGAAFDNDPLGVDPEVAWRDAASRAREALERPDALDGDVDTSAGTIPASEYVAQLTLDLAVHAWDLARAIGTDEVLDPALVEELYVMVESRADDLADSELFEDPVPVQPSADRQTRLLGLLGRAR